MIVAHSILVPRRGSGRLDPADEILVHQDAKCVVHSLSGDRPDDGPDVIGEFVSRDVRTGRHRSHDSQPLGGHLYSVLAQ